MSSSFNSTARALAILINKNIPVTIKETLIDPSGWLVSCEIYSEQWTAPKLIQPSYGHSSLFQDILLIIAEGQQNILVGNDITFFLVPILDKSTTTVSSLKPFQITVAFCSCLRNSHIGIDRFCLFRHNRTLDTP